jgi:hypothetical protein
MLPPVFVELKANIREFQMAMGEARKEITLLERHSASNFEKMAAVGKGALLGLGAVAVGVGGLSLKMAGEFEKAHTRLEVSLKNVGTSFEAQKSQIDKADAAMEKFGFTNANTQDALANLTTALKDPKKAYADLGLAADLAKYKNVDLATAALAVARAQEGNLRPLKQLGIDLPVAAGGAKAVAAAQATVATQTQKLTTFLHAHSNAMSTSSKYHLTYQQMVDKLTASQKKLKDAQSSGTDIMVGLAKAIHGQAQAASETFDGKLQHLKAQTEDVGKSIGLFLIPKIEKLVGAIASTIDWFKKHKAIAEAIGIVIGTGLVLAIGSYIASLAKAQFETARKLLTMIASWTGYTTTVETAATATTAAGAEMAAAGTAAQVAWLPFLGTLGTVAALAASTYVAGKSMKNNVIPGIVKGVENWALSIIPGINVPKHAAGGIVTRPQIGMIGEAGPEAIIPLNKAGGFGGGITIINNIQGSLVTEKQLAKQTLDNIGQLLRRQGASISVLGL